MYCIRFGRILRRKFKVCPLIMTKFSARLMMSGAAVGWGLGGPFIKLVGASPSLTVELRFLAGGIFFLFLLLYLRHLSFAFLRFQIPIAILAAFATAGFSIAVTLTDVSRAISLVFIYPAWTLVFQALWNRRRPHRHEIVLTIVATVAVLLITEKWPTEFNHLGIGDLCALACGISWSAVMVLSKALPDAKSNSSSMLIGFVFGALAAAPFVSSQELLSLTTTQWIWVLVVSVSTAIPFVLYTQGQSGISPLEAAYILVLELPSGIVAGIVVFGERPKPSSLVGVVLLITVALAAIRFDKQEPS